MINIGAAILLSELRNKANHELNILQFSFELKILLIREIMRIVFRISIF